MISSAPGVRLRIFEAKWDFSDTLALAARRLMWPILTRRCRRRLNSLLRSLALTFILLMVEFDPAARTQAV